MWCRAVCFMDTQEASSSILRMTDGGSMSRRNAGAICPSYTEAHPVILTLPPPSRPIRHIVTIRFSAKMCKQILCVGGSLSLVFEQASDTKTTNIPVIFRVCCMISPKPWYSYIFGLSYTLYIRDTSSMKGEFILDPESWNTVVSPACSITCARDRCVSLL
jgi:hypothetical protein